MFENNNFLILDANPKSFVNHNGSHDPDNLFFLTEFDSFNYLNDDIDSNSLSPLSFDIPDDFSEYNEALLSQLIAEFTDNPIPSPNDFDFIQETPDYNYINSDDSLSYQSEIISQRKRKQTSLSSHNKMSKCNKTVVKPPPKRARFDIDYSDDSYSIDKRDKRNCNSDAAFRYRQKQKRNKSQIEDDLNQSAIEMVTAKTEMMEMRKKLNTIKSIVRDLLRDKGFDRLDRSDR